MIPESWDKGEGVNFSAGEKVPFNCTGLWLKGWSPASADTCTVVAQGMEPCVCRYLHCYSSGTGALRLQISALGYSLEVVMELSIICRYLHWIMVGAVDELLLMG